MPPRRQAAPLIAIALLGVAAFFVVARPEPDALTTTAHAVRVIDGDTIDIAGERVRLLGIDAPEVFSPACPAEKALGLAASRRVRALIAAARTIEATREGTDRYGRTLARVYLDGQDLGALLIADDLAKPWPGHKVDFCRVG